MARPWSWSSSRSSSPVLRALVLTCVTCVASALACNRAPSADGLREWTPADHDRAEEQAGGGGAVAPTKPEDGRSALVEAAWTQNCALCHGEQGHGDGPNGPMVKASDLTRGAWQATVTDDAIASTIRQGKGRMPAFDLPDAVVAGLVKRIRASRGR